MTPRVSNVFVISKGGSEPDDVARWGCAARRGRLANPPAAPHAAANRSIRNNAEIRFHHIVSQS
jgi:hypothetical protein